MPPEALFDGRPEADSLLNANAKKFFTVLAAERKWVTIPADVKETMKLAKHHTNASVGEIEASISGIFESLRFRRVGRAARIRIRGALMN